MNVSTLISQLGGVTAVARLCDIKPPSVVGWRIHGVPHARLLYLRALAYQNERVASALAAAGYDQRSPDPPAQEVA